ncbi:MAG: hypothetical protein AB8B91_10140 [Rubripirellula sp.]
MRFLCTTLMLTVLSCTALCGADELTDKKFTDLMQALKPDASEAWRTIPWGIGLLDAQEQAAQQQKPIFIWAMDGHPLGCT